jgi:hypothetical protein
MVEMMEWMTVMHEDMNTLTAGIKTGEEIQKTIIGVVNMLVPNGNKPGKGSQRVDKMTRTHPLVERLCVFMNTIKSKIGDTPICGT